MDKHILEQYVSLQKERDDILRRRNKTRREIEQLERGGSMVADTVTRGKRGKKSMGTVKIQGFPTPEYTRKKSQLRRYESQLQEADDHLLETLNAVEEWIQSIEDSRKRLIFRYRYIDDLSWPAVARRMGRQHTADSCRMDHNRYLAKDKK